MKCFFYSSVALIALGLPALAQGVEIDVVSGNPNTSEYVVVGATRIPTPISEIASSVTVITAADIEARQQRSLPDVLRSVPGLNIVQTGGAGGQTALFLRGTNANHTKVLLDGIPMAPSDLNNGSPIYAQGYGTFAQNYCRNIGPGAHSLRVTISDVASGTNTGSLYLWDPMLHAEKSE